MLKFNKKVDQELEEGQISDDDGGEAPKRQAASSAKFPLRDHSSEESHEYVIEKVKIKNLSPHIERKPDRKEQKALEKAQHSERRRRLDNSPENHNFNRHQQLPPVNPYFAYPNQPVYSYPTSDPRAMQYMQPTQPPMHPLPYQSNPYMHQMQHWPVHSNSTPHPDYGASSKQQTHSYPYPQPMIYPSSPMYNGHSHKKTEYPSQKHQHQPQPRDTSSYQESPQQSEQERKKKQIEQQQKNRHKFLEETKQKIRAKLQDDKQVFTQLLHIVRNMVSENHLGDNSLLVVYRRLEDNQELKDKFYDILNLMQLKNIVEKLKEKELEMRVIGEQKKAKSAQIYQNLLSNDPRLRAR